MANIKMGVDGSSMIVDDRRHLATTKCSIQSVDSKRNEDMMHVGYGHLGWMDRREKCGR